MTETECLCLDVRSVKNLEKKILSIGSMAIDVVMEVNELPQDDSFSNIYRESLHVGGSSSNVSVGLANFNRNVSQLGKLGNDKYGDMLLNDFKMKGIDTSLLLVDDEGITFHTYIFVSSKGEHSIFVNLGNCFNKVHRHEFEDEKLLDFDFLYTDMFIPQITLELAEKAIAQKKDVIFNLQAAPSFMKETGVEWNEIQEIMRYSTLIIGGAKSFFEITGRNDKVASAQKIFNMFLPEKGVICTDGTNGSAWINDQKFYEFGVFDVETVDTTGAGDAFIAGIIESYFLEDLREKEALQFASACAAIKCSKSGPRAKITKNCVNEFLKHHM